MSPGERYALTDANGNLITYGSTIIVIVRQCVLDWNNINRHLGDKLPVMPAEGLELSEVIALVRTIPVAALGLRVYKCSYPLLGSSGTQYSRRS